jgi:PKHD-type hydroxylase
MMIQIPDLLTAEEVARCRSLIDAGDWIDGNATSGRQSALAKQNEQLSQDSEAAREAGELVRAALARSTLFTAAALPHTVFPPLFNRYGAGQTFGDHIDNAIRSHAEVRIRTGLSATLFLADPESYDGGELVVEDTYGLHEVKLPAGSLILYPASSLHRVEPVTRGVRVASFFWIQSLVRDDARRALLLEMDLAIQQLALDAGAAHRGIVSLTGVYHNMLRMWAEV